MNFFETLLKKKKNSKNNNKFNFDVQFHLK